MVLNKHVHKINRDLIMGWLLIVATLFVTYLGEVIKGERTWEYLITFMLVTATPAFVCLFLYKRKQDMVALRYCIVIGYFMMYVFSMITGSTSMVFSYILPLLSLLVLYHQPSLILIMGAASAVVNIISIAMKVRAGQMTLATSKDAEIQIALLVLCFGGSYIATKLYDEIKKENESYVRIVDEKNNQIKKMTLQTITTIANTIDAKDEYTKGHSKRVSDYSAAIAKELGFSESELRNIRSIALLHDIGKIGVPDSVLNKPGPLTNEEYHLMKQHTIIGAEILKDIGMIPGIDIGAKYHHERYDGKGYPDGLKKDEIPLIARIIAVADAYDAMTSNRVYRKRLSEEKVTEELRNGKGKQFDPDVTDALLKLIEEKRLQEISEENKEEQELKDATRILSRVMEKHEKQIVEGMQLDELTAVYNRSCGEKLICEALEKSKGCLMLFNLDHFRKVNDTNGFVGGDIFLKVTAECIKAIKKDMLISRFGGDEFVVYMRNVTTEEAAIEAINCFKKELSKRIEEWSELKGLSVSIGIVLCNEDIQLFSEMYQKADKALYFAKQQGGGAYHFHHEAEPVSENNLWRVDLDRLITLLRKKNYYESNLQLTYSEIGKIYDYVKEAADNSRHQVQILMFTVLSNSGADVSVEEKERVMGFLERAIVTTIREIDLTAKYSSVQQIAMLIDMSEEQIEAVADRIMIEFYKMYDSKEISVYYDIADLSQIQM